MSTSITAKMTRNIDIEKANHKELVKWYNENSGSSAKITKFKDDTIAREKCRELKQAIVDLSGGASKPAGAKQKPSAKLKKEAKAKKAPAAKKDKSADGEKKGQGRVSAFAGKKLYPKSKDNPRREGSEGFKSFSKIKSGMSYEAYIEAGGRASDLRWDVDHGFTEVK